MLIQNKTVIELTVQDAEKIIYENLREKYGDGEYAINFRVINKPYRSGVYIQDTIDRHEFDGVKVVITK